MKALITNPANAVAATSIIPVGAAYSGGAYTLTGILVGQAYSWVKGANDTNIVVNGSITITSSGVFTATATTVTLNGSGSSTITAIVSLTTLLYPGTFTPGLPARLVTQGQFSAANPNWIRQVQISDEAIFVKRGLFGVAITLADLVNLALSQEIGLTWSPPIVLTQPVSAICVGTAAAVGTLTNDGSQPADASTVVIGTKTYTWQTTLTNVDGHVKIGASNTASMTNLFHAINASGGTPGTDYATATTANTQVTATNPTGTTVVVTAITSGVAGNLIATTQAGTSHATWGGTTLASGTVAATTFTLSIGSEYVLTYLWQYSADGVTWNTASGTVNGCAYTNGTTATLTCTPTTTGQTGVFHRCVVTDDAGAYGGTNGAVNTNGAATLTIP